MNKDQAGNGMRKNGTGSGAENEPKFTLREVLLQHILSAIQYAESENNFAEALEAELWANGGLRYLVISYRTDCLIAQRKILSSLPQKSKETVKTFIRELLISGGGIGHC